MIHTNNNDEEQIWRDSYGVTDVGRVRLTNEDEFLVALLRREMSVPLTSLDRAGMHDPDARAVEDGVIMAVADGVGGHSGGAQASSLVLQSLHQAIAEEIPWTTTSDRRQEAEFVRRMKSAIRLCRDRLSAVASTAANRHLATTLTATCVFWPFLYVFHLGDSRCYLLRSDKIERLTNDHTVAQEFADKGIVKEGDRAYDKFQNVLWNCVQAGAEEMKPEVTKYRLEPDDVVLLCTDGLYNEVSEAEIHAIVQEEDTAQGSCKRLLEEANKRGGSDNITIVQTRFVGLDRTGNAVQYRCLRNFGREREEPKPAVETVHARRKPIVEHELNTVLTGDAGSRSPSSPLRDAR